MDAWRRNSSRGRDGGATAAGRHDSGGHNNTTFTTNTACDTWDINTRCSFDWTTPASVTVTEAGVVQALLFGVTNDTSGAGVHSNRMPDPHMMCLKLGKRHYCEDTVTTAESSTATRRGKIPQYPFQYLNPYYKSDIGTVSKGTSSVVPRCQVEGCYVTLGNVKEYYRKHKVCEIHSKAPKVVMSGLQQRFCQQCSRFHRVTEFDEAKRSCRRRLKGHNQRRRKGTHSMERRLGPLPLSNQECALSLLSYPETEPWNSSVDLSSRCSAALYELIAANRATSVFLNQNGYDQSVALPDTQMWDRFSHTTTTPELKQGLPLEFGLLSMKERSKDEEAEEWTDYCWSSFGGSNVM